MDTFSFGVVGFSTPIGAPSSSAGWSGLTGAVRPFSCSQMPPFLRVSRFVVCRALVPEAGVPPAGVVPAFDAVTCFSSALRGARQGPPKPKICALIAPRTQRSDESGRLPRTARRLSTTTTGRKTGSTMRRSEPSRPAKQTTRPAEARVPSGFPDRQRGRPQGSQGMQRKPARLQAVRERSGAGVEPTNRGATTACRF